MRWLRTLYRRWQLRRYRAYLDKPYVSAYDRKQSEVRAARMGGHNLPSAWRGK